MTHKDEQQQQREQVVNDEETTNLSPVTQMFAGRSVFITGASGFIGRVLLEKLLRVYGVQLKRVYILMRSKKNMSPNERLHGQLLKAPIFDKLRAHDTTRALFDKIIVISGDIGEDNLGISEQDLQTLYDDPTLSIVFHSAATVKFDEPLKLSVKFNLIATQTIIEICKKLPNLISLCHVSTAYANADIRDQRAIEEQLYPIAGGQTPDELIQMSSLLNENLMQKLKPALVGERPNTYTYTKALAEHLIALEASQLPVAIVRPSIVVAAWKEPLAGWIDNLNGPTGLILAIGKGLLRSMHVRREAVADIVPVDVVVNTMIAAAYYAAHDSGKLSNELTKKITAATRTSVQEEEKVVEKNDEQDIKEVKQNQKLPTKSTTPPIFHCTSGDTNPITWGQMEDMFFPIIRNYPSQQVLRYPFGSFKGNKYHDLITRLFVHYLPALIIDFICLIMGKKRQLLSIYYKLHCAIGALSHFSTTTYRFKSTRSQQLRALLTDERDQRHLYMDISSLNWYSFWDDYVLGARRFVLKEKDETLDESRKSFKKAYYLEIALRTFLLLLLCFIFSPQLTRLCWQATSLLTSSQLGFSSNNNNNNMKIATASNFVTV